MKKLTIVPLALPSSITCTAYNTIKSTADSNCVLMVQTLLHPSSRFIDDEGLNCTTMDDLYAAAEDFDSLNSSIAQRLMSSLSDVVYAVPGRGICGAQLSAIKTLAGSRGVEVNLLASSGYSEAAAAKASFCFQNMLTFVASELPGELDVYSPIAIEEIDNGLRASELKLKLLEYYPANKEALFCCTDEHGEYLASKIQLFELDRQKRYFATTVLLISPMTYLQLGSYGFSDVVTMMKMLRDPVSGCPWDIKQTHESLKTPLIEEAYEVMDAICSEDTDSLLEELGDLMLQVVFHAQIEAERGEFTMRDVCTGLIKKLIYRHPHVFAARTDINSADDVVVAWEELKKAEKNQASQTDAMNSVPRSFPALMRSFKVQKKAHNVGFDWDSHEGAIMKLTEEISELKTAIASANSAAIVDEMGDVLFTVVNISRLLGIDPELALTDATDKFMLRFSVMEKAAAAAGKNLNDLSLAELDNLWNNAKRSLLQK